MNDINKKLNIQVEIEKADACQRQADILLASQEYDGATSRAYYAVFHYVTALLLTKGIEARSHEGLVRMFNLHFIKTGLLPKECSSILSHAQRAREEADYWPEIPFSKEDAELRIAEIKKLVSRIKTLL